MGQLNDGYQRHRLELTASPSWYASSGVFGALNTGNANVDGLLWIKPPGEADGCAFTAGSFQASLAFSLSTGVALCSETVAGVGLISALLAASRFASSKTSDNGRPEESS